MKNILQAFAVSALISALIAFAFAWKAYDAIMAARIRHGLSIDRSVSFVSDPGFYGPFLTILVLSFIASWSSSTIVLVLSRRKEMAHGVSSGEL